MNTATQWLGRGERAPDFVLPIQNGTPTRFYSRAGGGATVLLFCDADDTLLRFSEALGDCASGAVSIFAVKRAGAEPQVPTGQAIPFPVFSDTEGKVRAAYRLGDEGKTVLFVFDPNLRALGSLALKDARVAAQKAVSLLDASLPRVEPLEIVTQAPVLLIPNVLDEEVCEFLMGVWENQGNVETGVEQSRGDRRVDTVDDENKRRRDHVVTDEKLLRLLSSTIGRRVMPEVYKAFAFRATRFEGFKIACYDAATGGFFHAHRDNLSPSTAHRRFALTLNLNEGYAGGYLRFPEYGPHLYRPEAGGAILFSSSHLHEVTEVTEGRRFTLLSFLFGEGDVRASREAPGEGSA